MSQTSRILKELVSQLNTSIAPELQQDEYFELFCNEQVLKDYDLSYDEIAIGTVGNGGDGGIDGIFLIVNDVLVNPNEDPPRVKGSPRIEIHLIQSKNEESFGETVIEKFKSSAEDIFDLGKTILELSSVYNSDLLKQVAKFRDIYINNLAKSPVLSIHYYYASRGEEIHPNVERKVESLKEVIKGLFSTANFHFKFVTATKLFELANKKPKASFTLKLKENAISMEDGGYICIAELNEYYEFITEDTGKIQKHLFDANVRDYQGGVTVNKEIFNTLKHESQYEFWWLNNGITIVADTASVSSKILSISNPQIVNGCQTSFEIHSYYTKETVTDEKRSLTIRVIQTEDEVIKAKVIKSTNSQTSIPPAVLSATDPIHRSIEQHFLHQSLFYDRRKNFWKNEGKPKQSIIPISYLAQIIKSMIIQEPHISRGKPSTLIKNKDDYQEIFNKEYDLQLYSKTFLLAKKIEEESSNATYLNKGDWLNIRYFVYSHFISKQLPRHMNESHSEYILRFLDADFETDSIQSSIKKVFDIYTEKGGTDGVAKAKYFTEAVIAEEEEQTR